MAVKISELSAGTPPYAADTLVEVSVPTGSPPSYTSAKAQLGDLMDAVIGDGEGLDLGEGDPATAPGAGKLRIVIVAGTDAGTAKILLYAGTSTTPLVLADNVGSGF